MRREPFEIRFWRKVLKQEGDGCWLWTGTLNDKGYGSIGTGGTPTMMKAHRASYEINVGPIPEGMDICHTCDNPPCVRPDHLFPGTKKLNTQDSVAKGRHSSLRCGGAANRSKLSDEARALIRASYATGKINSYDLGRAFEVHPSTVAKLLRTS